MDNHNLPVFVALTKEFCLQQSVQSLDNKSEVIDQKPQLGIVKNSILFNYIEIIYYGIFTQWGLFA